MSRTVTENAANLAAGTVVTNAPGPERYGTSLEAIRPTGATYDSTSLTHQARRMMKLRLHLR
jgi:hypothetical protein